MSLIERLLILARAWSEASGRPETTLSSRVVNDGKLVDRLRAGGGCNVATAERFFAFFRDGKNWPEGAPPSIVGETLDGVDLAQADVLLPHSQADAA